MTHLDEGLLRALLDGETVDGGEASAIGHLDECDRCQALLDELRDAGSVVGTALAHLDTVPAPVGAKAAVLAQVGFDVPDATRTPDAAIPQDISPTAPARPTGVAPTLTERFAFARAAILVLLLGGVVATALPASPLSGWIAGGWDRAVTLFTGPTQAESAATPAESTLTPQTPEFAGVSLEVESGELIVLLLDIEPGTELDVRLVDGFQAAAFAAQPARFRTAEGLIEVTGGSGRVRIDIPRSVEVASIHVNGRMYLTKAGDELDVAGPIVTRTSGEIRLRVQ